jgi:drug/metabolite transporter (DMT)-like permease
MSPRDLTAFGSNVRDAPSAALRHHAPMINRTMDASDWSSLLLLGLIWGGAFFFIDVAVAEVAPLTFVWVRLSIAAAILWLYLWARGQVPALPLGAVGAMLVLALLNNAVPFALFAWSQTHIDGGLSSILNATSPIWTVLVAHVATSDERMTPGKLAGVLLGFAGVAAMIGPDLLTTLGDQALAQLAALAGAFCYALAGVWARRFRAMRIAPTTVAAWQLALAAAIMAPVALVADRPWTAAMPSLGAISAILALAIVCSAFAYILYFRIIDRAGATNALLVTLLTPPIAIGLAALFMGEQLGVQHFVGLGLIALGLAAIDGRLFSRLAAPAALRRAA